MRVCLFVNMIWGRGLQTYRGVLAEGPLLLHSQTTLPEPSLRSRHRSPIPQTEHQHPALGNLARDSRYRSRNFSSLGTSGIPLSPNMTDTCCSRPKCPAQLRREVSKMKLLVRFDHYRGAMGLTLIQPPPWTPWNTRIAITRRE